MSKSIHVYGDVHKTRKCIIAYSEEYNHPVCRDNVRIYVDAKLRDETKQKTDIVTVPKSIRGMEEMLTPMKDYDPDGYLVMVVTGYPKMNDIQTEDDVAVVYMDDTIMNNVPKEEDIVMASMKKFFTVVLLWGLVIWCAKVAGAFYVNE